MQHAPEPRKNSRGGLWGFMLAVVLIALISGLVASHRSTSPPSDQARIDHLLATLTARQTAGAVEVGQFAAVQTAEASSLQTPRPTQSATCQAVNNNPWCDNFRPGNLIYHPPSNFCDYFTCVASFWGADDPGDGYVVQCSDGMYSQAGGEPEACSSHGGVYRPLYSH